MTAKPTSPDWLRPLPRVIVIPQVMTIKTLWDVRELVERHLPAETRKKSTWVKSGHRDAFGHVRFAPESGHDTDIARCRQ
jgi:hypothetical protein